MTATERNLTESEYLEIERAAPFRSEFLNGYMYPLGEPPRGSAKNSSARHSLLQKNTLRSLRHLLDSRIACAANTGIDLHPKELTVTADIRVSHPSDISNPSLIIEVLSPATEAYDRGTKFSLYRSIASLRDYILISQESATIDHFHKNDAGQWILANDGHPDTLQLPHLDVSIPYAEIYANVEFEQ